MQTQIHEAPSPTTLGKSNHPAIFRISIPDGDSGNDLELHLAPLDSKNGDGLPADRVYVQASTERRWLEIAFRQFYAPLPWGWEPGLHWSVEAYERGMEQPPIGFCWVLDTSPQLPPESQHEAYQPLVEYIRVFHTHHRCGVATALVDAARVRWPNLHIGEAAFNEGQAFLDTYLAREASRSPKPSDSMKVTSKAAKPRNTIHSPLPST